MIHLLDIMKPNNSIKQNKDEINSSKYQDQNVQQEVQNNKNLLKVDRSSKSPFVPSTFKNSSMIKEELLVTKFYPVITGLQEKFLSQIKIQPTMFINKIQEPRLHLKSSIICKELAYDIILEESQLGKSQLTKNYKIKNCISPSRPNSQIYKRLSKNFFENIKNGVNQCLLFTGLQNQARLQSSIGNQNNPGIFMIIAIAILDQKYKGHHQRFDVQFSFLEYKGQKLYDLINNTRIPLQPKSRDHKNSKNQFEIQFSQHSVKVNTFLQFIKLFKIALFNNKQRDFKTNKNLPTDQKFYGQQKGSESFSTFIMKIKIKKYNIENDLIYEQQSLLIDLNQKKSNKSSQTVSQIPVRNDKIPIKNDKISLQRRQNRSYNYSRELIDYILIEMNNSNPNNKLIHYHMVQKNPLLQILKKYLRRTQKQNTQPRSMNSSSGQIMSKNQKSISHKAANNYIASKQQNNDYFLGGQMFIINSFTTSSNNYLQNTKFYQSLSSALGDDWQCNFRSNPKPNTFLDVNFAQKVLQKVTHAIQNRKYTSLRDLFTVKQFYIKQSKRIITLMKSYKTVIIEYLRLKKQLKYSQNLLTAYELQLIGKCIKSDNFKDFYTFKSYIELSRQVQIKTENVRAEIITCNKELKQVQDKLEIVKKNEMDGKKSMKDPPACLLNTIKQNLIEGKPSNNTLDKQSSVKKFKLLENIKESCLFFQFNDLEQFLALRRYISDYLQQIWYKVYLTDQRTITESMIFQDSFIQQIDLLITRITNFNIEVKQIDQSSIKCFKDGNLLSLKNFTQLIRSINEAKRSILKHGPQHPGKSPFSLRNQLIKNESLKTKFDNKNKLIGLKTPNLPKIEQNKNARETHEYKSLQIIQQSKHNEKTPTKHSHKINKLNHYGQKQNKHVLIFDIKGKVNFQGLILNPSRV